MDDTIFSDEEYTTVEKQEQMQGMLYRKPLKDANSYYRSNTFVTNTAINPLIAVASPILVLNAQLGEAVEYKNVSKLYQDLVHEVNAFESNAQNRGYRTEVVLIARYIMCAVLDETIINTTWGTDHNWQKNTLLDTFQAEKSADELFFLIVDRVSEDPKPHIDLLELIYLCLSLGFEGKYRESNRGKYEIDKILDILYQRIALFRDEPKALVSKVAQIETHTTYGKQPSSILSLALKTGLVTVAIVTVFYLGLSYMFNDITSPLQKTLKMATQVTINIPKNKR